MAIQHKFLHHDFGNGFQTHNAILDVTPYKPEVMIVGTFNPGTPNANFADFFYGRNYLWTAFKNLFIHHQIVHTGRRIGGNAVNPPLILNPTLNEILDLSNKLKITFSDLISEVLPNQDIVGQMLENNILNLNGIQYDLINDGDLNLLDNIGEVSWSTNSIIEHLIQNPQIKSIYLTRRPQGIWGNQWTLIKQAFPANERHFSNIFTPSGMGLGTGPRMHNLLHHWLHNENPNFGQFDHDWLIRNGVNPNDF